MFKIESYVTPILLSYVDKYVRDFKPVDAQLSLWGGGVGLHNLVLKPDVLQQEVSLPFTLISGRIHELLIHVPWTKIMSEPIVVTIDTIECILSLNPPAPTDDVPTDDEPQSRKTQVVEAPPGYMQALVRRIVSNIAVRVHHLIVKYVQDDVVLSLNVKHLSIDSTGPDWKPSFADIDQNLPMIRRLVKLDDLTLCLDRCDSDGKIRFYQEPLLYRCQLDLRVLTRLVSANTRRASCLSVQLRSSKLAWGVTSEQLILLMRLLRERNNLPDKTSSPVPKSAAVKTTHQSVSLYTTSSNSAEPARRESWSDWAWSWLPLWNEGGVDEAPVPATPTPVYFTAYCDDISVVFKAMELEGGNRKRARGILELTATHAAVKSYMCMPTALRWRMGMRALVMKSQGKCVCGHIDMNAAIDESTSYISRLGDQTEDDWTWPDEDFEGIEVETAEAVGEEYTEHEKNTEEKTTSRGGSPHPEEAGQKKTEPPKEKIEKIWENMKPVFFFEYTHDRSPPTPCTSAYDNPPDDFQYSDWGEECKLNVQLQPLELRLCMGLVHRVSAFVNILKDLPPIPDQELSLRTLTVEECDALLNNLPQRRINIDIKDLRLRLHPWDHSLIERPVKWPLVLDIEIPKGSVVITCPLYPFRVCSAACQMPDDTGVLSQGARLHVCATFTSIEAKLNAPCDSQPKPKPCARTDLKLVLHVLLNRQLFNRKETVAYSFSSKIHEANMSGSAARLQAAWQILTSILSEKVSLPLKYTSLAKDALKDEESVALDMTLEELGIRGYVTANSNTQVVTLQSLRVTVFHSQQQGILKQAWVFSAPDIPSTTPYMRTVVQWCWEQLPTSIDYVGVWTEPAAVCIDPLFIAWLAYKPRIKPYIDLQSNAPPMNRTISSTQYFMRRRVTPPSSSGRGGSRSGSGTELVHVRPRSAESGSEQSEKKDLPVPVHTIKKELIKAEDLLKLQERLRHVLVTVELGLVIVYVTMSTASAVDCATVRLAMEQHASASHRVLALNLGRWHMHSDVNTKQLWEDIKHDGPTFMTEENRATLKESFPWKAKFADVSCYTLEVRPSSETPSPTKGLRSQLKYRNIHPRSILELVTTSVTMSMVTKAVHYKTYNRKPSQKKAKEAEQDKRTKYFTAGTSFKPTTLKEFVRGPASRKKTTDKSEPPPPPEPAPSVEPDSKIVVGPVVAVGVHLHADTPPISIKLDHDQIHVVAAAIHCFTHILTLISRAPLVLAKPGQTSQSLGGKIKSVCELDEQSLEESENDSESRSELIPLFQAHPEQEKVPSVTKFLWFQWVISRATVVVAAEQVKLAFQIEDIITSIDLQEHYNQLKVKVGSAAIRHFKRSGSDDWTAGVLGGRVLEAREPGSDREDTHFLAVTVTQAQISNLPPSWREELHPKILDQKENLDSVWEIYAMLAPLEAVLQPDVLENLMSFAHEMAPRPLCPLQTEAERKASWQWPFCYINAGGLRLLVTCDHTDHATDDTIMIIFGRTTISPHPENPICRRPISAGLEASWLAAGGGYEGRQYEIVMKSVEVRTARFAELVLHEESVTEGLAGIGGENPARKWSQAVVTPTMTPLIRPVDVNCVLAPAVFFGTSLICGRGIEINLVTDCAVELSIEQLELVQCISRGTSYAFRNRQYSSQQLQADKSGVCPYGTVLLSRVSADDLDSSSDSSVSEVPVADIPKNVSDPGRSVAEDSGVDTVTTRSTMKSPQKVGEEPPLNKKSVSLCLFEIVTDPKDYIELFVTMGAIELSLYTADDNSPEVIALRPKGKGPRPFPKTSTEEEAKESHNDESTRNDVIQPKRPSDTINNLDLQKNKYDLLNIAPQSKKAESIVPLLHISLHQPNLYYWRRKTQGSLQVSLFNARMDLGAPPHEDYWHAVLISTARGDSDPATDIPPALATMKLSLPAAGSTYLGAQATPTRGSLRLDIERPVMFEICADRLKRLRQILELVQSKVPQQYTDSEESEETPLPALYKLRLFMVQNSIETATIQTSQVGVSGHEGSIGWDSASLQVALGARPDRLVARGLVCAALVAAGPSSEPRHSVLQPLQLGFKLDGSWEAWRRAEGGMVCRDPSVHMIVEIDNVIIDVRPEDMSALDRIRKILMEHMNTNVDSQSPRSAVPWSTNCDGIVNTQPTGAGAPCLSSVNFEHQTSRSPTESTDADHYYKDDLRSGAFKIVSGGQFPMAYQVTLLSAAVSWRYPHPRAITRLVTYPLPGYNTETACILEMYNRMLERWEPHTYFNMPLIEPREVQVYVPSPETVFATTWRIRVCSNAQQRPYVFSMDKFTPKQDPFTSRTPTTVEEDSGIIRVTAEELSGVLRVDSYFAPHLLPRLRVSVQLASMEIHAHNLQLYHRSPAPELEGYYVSKPQMRSHRVLTLCANQTTMYAEVGSAAGMLMLMKTELSSNILECSSGTMEPLINEFHMQAGLSLPSGKLTNSRMRFRASDMRVAMHVPRLRTIQALAADWKHGFDQIGKPLERSEIKREISNTSMAELEGRVSMWIHNTCAVALRVGQDTTDEVLPLASGARLAYRWRNPTAIKKLHFALTNPSVDWHWSDTVSFAPGNYRIRLEDDENLLPNGGELHLHVDVEQMGSIKCMRLSGRLILANMLRMGLLYKVRIHLKQQNTWRTISSGELSPEAIGRNVVCGSNCDMVLKMRLLNQDSGWSGDIPLKECVKENVPWLVKVPREGDTPYMSVWCRVVRARHDGRVLATVWPLYVLHSHLPLDTDVLIGTENSSTEEPSKDARPTPLIQPAPGRGVCTHLVTPGTTSAKHSLSFQYRNVECPVTREAVPLHYGVTDISVFDKRAPVTNIEEVIQEVNTWLSHSSQDADMTWPYSLVANHWPGTWQPALLQPRCDVNVKYQAVKAGGGCSMDVQLSPVVLLCNASPTVLTLRAHDAAPLCKLEPGAAISPSTAMLTKPFFMSIELGRDTFVSGQLAICSTDPGRYGALPPGQVGLDHPAHFAIQCNHKVALFTLYYEIKQDINVLGISSTFSILNLLGSNVLISSIAVAGKTNKDVQLNPKTFKVLPPTKENTITGMPLCRFWLRDRWRGGDAAQLYTYLCLALPSRAGPANTPVPVRIGKGPARQSLALIDRKNQSVAVVVTQHKHEGRWLVTVGHDACPQFVVHNCTRHAMAVAEPKRRSGDEPSASVTTAVRSCRGARWWCVVSPRAARHYSTPAYSARLAPDTDTKHAITFVTFARVNDDDMEPEWCPAVAVADGEQLIQLQRGVTVKMRVRTHPHSTLIELQDVDQTDISASDIRRRLVGPFSSDESIPPLASVNFDDGVVRRHSLGRIGVEESLLQRSEQHSVRMPDQGVVHTVTPTVKTCSETSLDTSKTIAVSGHKRDMLADEETASNSIHADYGLPSNDATTSTQKLGTDSCTMKLDAMIPSAQPLSSLGMCSFIFKDGNELAAERIRGVVASITLDMAATGGSQPLFALHIDRAALLVRSLATKTRTTLSIADMQVDNLQYDTEQYDFAVVATTRCEPLAADRWPTLWNMYAQQEAFATRQADARLVLNLCHDKWEVIMFHFNELTEVDIRVGPLALYLEDSYMKALLELYQLTVPPIVVTSALSALAEARALQCPLRLRLLHIHPLELTLTLHTAMRMYIALDQSPLHLSAFKVQNMMTSAERLAHAFTVHYLSAAILGAGWVVGGLELLGAPGALAARVGGASGGVRGIASAAAAALLRSLSAWAGSLARNLDLLAGDEEHARRAAAARRRAPHSLLAGLSAGIANFAINILGAVGGLAHHPLVGVAVGETGSSAAALRRSLLGAVAKPLSATADLVAYAGHGLLNQTGWDPVPQPRPVLPPRERPSAGWRRDCVRWAFRLADIPVLEGFEVQLNSAHLDLLITHRYIVVAEPESEHVLEMIDFRYCTLKPFQGPIIELSVSQRRPSQTPDVVPDDEDDYQLSAAAMARVARYTGAAGTPAAEARVLSVVPAPGRAHALHAALATAIHNNSDTHFPLM